MPLDTEPLNLLSDVLAEAKRKGADSADAVVFSGASLAIAVRMGALEKLERSEARDLGLRVLIGKRQAIVSSNDFKRETLSELIDRAVATARAAPEDPYTGIADPDQLAKSVPTLDICDEVEPSAEKLIAAARAAEDAARAVKGVTNSEGAEIGWSRSVIALAATNGFARGYGSSSNSIAASVLAGEGTAMERDYDFSSAVYGADLRKPEDVGRSAGERAVKRLGARKMKSARVPIVFDNRVSNGLLRSLSGAINGAAIARGTSFLKDKMGERIFPAGINVIDDPHRARGLRSKPFDAEGLANVRRAIIEDGRLTTWMLDLASARKLGLPPTGHATRGTASPPSPSSTNFYMEKGKISRDAMIKGIDEGFLVTELIGMGVSMITGDYSRGASGFWIEKGAIAYPVSEITVAGNLKDMFLNLTAADDLEFKTGTDAPSLRVDGMTVAGT
jgi:PmbA protein